MCVLEPMGAQSVAIWSTFGDLFVTFSRSGDIAVSVNSIVVFEDFRVMGCLESAHISGLFPGSLSEGSPRHSRGHFKRFSEPLGDPLGFSLPPLACWAE